MPAVLRSQRVKEWNDLDLGDGQSIRVRIEPPSYEALVLARGELSTPEACLRRFDCVVDWDEVTSDPAEGPSKPIPFSRERLKELLRDFPVAYNNLLTLINPLFLRRDEDAAKNSGSQSDSGTAPTPPSTTTPTSGNSADSATPLETASPSPS